MKKYWKSLLTVGSIATLSASTAFGQAGYFGYNGGACAPNCELPPVCEPVAPACEPVCAPVCDVPPAACAPTCDVPPAPCAPTCDPYYGAGCGYGGFGCYPCYDLAAFVGGVLDVATAPFHWAASMLTEGIYPDCGCAPRPPKTNCDPCDICGNFVGGCGEECDAPPCAGAGYGYDNYNGFNGYNGGYATGYDAGSYPVGAYDSEAYDASPTRRQAPAGVPASSNAAPETLPQEAVQRGSVSFAPRPQAPQYRRPSFAFGGFDVRALVGNTRQTSNFATAHPLPPTRDAAFQGEYAARPIAPDALNASPIRQVSASTQPTQNAPIRQAAGVSPSTQIRQSARYPQPTQTAVVPNIPNVRSTQPRQIVDATPLVEERATGRPRTFGQVRPNPTNAR